MSPESEKTVPTEVPISRESTKEEPENEAKIIETTTSLPEPNEIGAPPIAEIISTTPNPPAKVEEEKPKPVEAEVVPEILPSMENTTNPMTNETDLEVPEFKEIPKTTPQVSNVTKEEAKPAIDSSNVDTKQEFKVPGTANVIATPPPLLGLGRKSQVSKDGAKKNVKKEENVKEVDLKTPEKEVKSEEVSKVITDELKIENTNSSEISPVPVVDSKPPEEEVKSEEVTKVTVEESLKVEITNSSEVSSVSVQDSKPVEVEVKPEEVTKIMTDEPIKFETTNSSDVSLLSVEETVEKSTDSKELKEKSIEPVANPEIPKQEETAELEKVKEKLGVAPEDPVKVEQNEVPTSQEETKVDIQSKPLEKTIEPLETKTEIPSIHSLGIDTYGNPPPPMKPLEDLSEPISEEKKTLIDDKLDLHDHSNETVVPVPAVESVTEIPSSLPEQTPAEVPKEILEKVQKPEPKETEHEHKHKDHDFHHKRETIRHLLEAEVPKHGSEIDSSEVKEAEIPVKQGVPSIIEIRRNGKIVTPKDFPEETSK